MNSQNYINRRDLRELGYTQTDDIFLPILAKANQEVAVGIDKEARMGMTAKTLREYKKLLKKFDFTSDQVQNWLKQHVIDLDEITTDRVMITLEELRKSGSK
ncbi:MAG: hypothetical protein LBQ02_00585 [Candidatus Nomurabacteria bacterium]|jgi:hypothetical protein|nr:hypothetical protein [Candidatus Nomurabacteria bacterium]